MAIERSSVGELLLGLLTLNPVSFTEYFWSDELSGGGQRRPALSTKQRVMVADRSRRQIACTGRKVGKTLKIESRFIQIALTNTGTQREGMFVTPGEAHIKPVLERIESRISRTPLFRLAHRGTNRSAGMMFWHTGYTWHLRIEGTSGTGRNMIGLRCSHILGDEMAYGDPAAHRERIQSALPDCFWDLNGVPNGVRTSPFYRLDQTEEGAGWSRHHLSSYDNPIYWPVEEHRPRLIEQYGSEHDPDYINQVLGQWGDEATSAFSREAIHLSDEIPYVARIISQREIADNLSSVDSIIRLPRPRDAVRWAMGVDVGFGGADPYVIKVAYQNKDGVWCDTARFNLIRFHQALYAAYAIAEIARQATPMDCICIDTAGYGKAVVDCLTGPTAAPYLAGITDWESIIISADAGGKTEVPHPTDPAQRQFIGNKHFMTIRLKHYLANGQLLFAATRSPDGELEPVDQIQIEELLTTAEERTPSGAVVYKPARRGEEHITDALRYLVRAIDNITQRDEQDEGEIAAWVEYAWAR